MTASAEGAGMAHRVTGVTGYAPSRLIRGIDGMRNQRKESGECGTGDNWAAQHHLHDAPTQNGYSACDGSANSQSPICILIEAQHLSGEGHAKRHEQKKHTYDPGQLARKLVSAEEEDLHHVDQNNRHHKV